MKDTNLFVESYCKEFTPFNWYVIQHQLQLLKQHKIATKSIIKLIARRGKLYNEVIDTIPTFQQNDNDGKRGVYIIIITLYLILSPFFFFNSNFLSFTLISLNFT